MLGSQRPQAFAHDLGFLLDNSDACRVAWVGSWRPQGIGRHRVRRSIAFVYVSFYRIPAVRQLAAIFRAIAFAHLSGVICLRDARIRRMPHSWSLHTACLA
ncbi:hypothetical protein DYGSA30_25410 [Dyella sp. GSA-30]|nr:hypothetical protein DYGSA30_25410 [Dyella sp. GSA-30]